MDDYRAASDFSYVIPAIYPRYSRYLLRHSRESGNPEGGGRHWSRPEPSMNRERQIPSPFMGLQG